MQPGQKQEHINKYNEKHTDFLDEDFGRKWEIRKKKQNQKNSEDNFDDLTS